jgi:hypothetical protein
MPSVTDFKPRIGWKEIRRWLEAMQLIAAAVRAVIGLATTALATWTRDEINARTS